VVCSHNSLFELAAKTSAWGLAPNAFAQTDRRLLELMAYMMLDLEKLGFFFLAYLQFRSAPSVVSLYAWGGCPAVRARDRVFVNRESWYHIRGSDSILSRRIDTGLPTQLTRNIARVAQVTTAQKVELIRAYCALAACFAGKLDQVPDEKILAACLLRDLRIGESEDLDALYVMFCFV
jgi:hypothetical protein